MMNTATATTEGATMTDIAYRHDSAAEYLADRDSKLAQIAKMNSIRHAYEAAFIGDAPSAPVTDAWNALHDAITALRCYVQDLDIENSCYALAVVRDLTPIPPA